MRTKTVIKTLLLALTLICVPFAALPALSQGSGGAQIEAGAGPACDTAEQMEKALLAFDGNVQTAIEKVNAETGIKEACIFAGLYYQRVGEVKRVRVPAGLFAIVEIRVMGVHTEIGPRPLPQPVTWFTAFFIRDDPGA